AAGGDYERLVLKGQLFQQVRLQSPESSLSMPFKNLRDCHPLLVFNQAIGIEDGPAQTLPQRMGTGRLSRSWRSDKNNHLRYVLRHWQQAEARQQRTRRRLRSIIGCRGSGAALAAEEDGGRSLDLIETEGAPGSHGCPALGLSNFFLSAAQGGLEGEGAL